MGRDIMAVIVLVCLCAWMSTCLGHNSFTDDIYARLQALEDKDHEQDILLEQYKADIQALTSVVSLQSSRLQHQDTLLRGFVKKVSKLEKQITRLQKDKAVTQQPDDDDQVRAVENCDDQVEKNELKIQTPTADVNKKERIRKSDGNYGPVLFHAVYKAVSPLTSSSITAGNTLKLPDVMSNLGGAYNSNSGVFTATQPGVYLFSLSVESNEGQFGNVDIVKNGNVLSRARGDGTTSSFDQGSVTVATQMAAGDMVWARLYVNLPSELFGNWETSFMGLLVIPL